ncbi:reverse transcriptase domain-containing protein [Tanacetum coccineum]
MHSFTHSSSYALSQYVLYELSQYVLYALRQLCTQSVCALRTQPVALSQYVLYALKQLCTQSVCALRTQPVMYSVRFFQIPIAPEDQEKTTFTIPYATFAYRQMPFGLSNLDIMVARCEETNLVLNWEKCHFMVKEGIVLGHKISKAEIEVDRAKIDVIAKLPYPTNVKGVRSFLGHAGIYRRFIKYFSMISKPMTQLLMKDIKFYFSDDCKKAFNILKEKVTTAPIIISLDWNAPFELMYDASDFAVGAVLGQRIDGKFKPIYYVSDSSDSIYIK